MSLLAKLRSRLAVRIYAVGLAQMIVVGLGFWVITEIARPPTPSENDARDRAIIEDVVRQLPDAAAVHATLEAVRDDQGVQITMFDPSGEVLATTVPDDAPACAPPPGRRWDSEPGRNEPAPMSSGRQTPAPPMASKRSPPGPPSGPLCRTMAISFPDGSLGRIEFRRTRPPPPPSPLSFPVLVLMLVVVGVSSMLLARSLGRPLRRLAGAARALGSGDLDARAHIERRDELGEVAQAFDEMADRVRELLRAEKELVANVSHELRTPLSRIRVALDIAAEGDAAAAQESLADIADDLDELERLVSDVLTAARLDLAVQEPRGIPPLRSEAIDPVALLEATRERKQTAHPERPIRIEIEGSLPAIEGDPALLRRVFDNLVENSHKYTESPEEPIVLAARAEGERLLVEVRDRGIGIDAKDRTGVFRPFFRVDRSRTRATGGLGLGLALAKRIVQAHGGTIDLESEPGVGTTVRVRLPGASTSGPASS